jgi:hypothetical protein
MQLHAEEAVSAHMANLQEEFFIQAKRIKTPFVGISDKETQFYFDQCNGIKPMVCFKISR